MYHEICEYAKAHHVDVPLGSIVCGTIAESVALVIEKANSMSAAARHFLER